MSFSWPWALLALLVIPLVFAIWWLTRLRKRRAAVRVTSIALVRTARPGRSRWRRRIPAALLTLGLAVLAVGAASPPPRPGGRRGARAGGPPPGARGGGEPGGVVVVPTEGGTGGGGGGGGGGRGAGAGGGRFSRGGEGREKGGRRPSEPESRL